MKKFIETYKGADIYEVRSIADNEGEEIEKRLTTNAVIPGSPNLHTDLMEDGETLEAAIVKMHAAIDRYLSQHQLHHFGSEDS